MRLRSGPDPLPARAQVQTPVAIVDANIERCPARTRGATRAAAEAFVDYLFTPAAQAEFEAVGFRHACRSPSPDCHDAVGPGRARPCTAVASRPCRRPWHDRFPASQAVRSLAPGQHRAGSAGRSGLCWCFRECARTDWRWVLGASLALTLYTGDVKHVMRSVAQLMSCCASGQGPNDTHMTAIVGRERLAADLAGVAVCRLGHADVCRSGHRASVSEVAFGTMPAHSASLPSRSRPRQTLPWRAQAGRQDAGQAQQAAQGQQGVGGGR